MFQEIGNKCGVWGKRANQQRIVTLVPCISKSMSFAPVIGLFSEVLYTNAKNLLLFTFGVEDLMVSVSCRLSLQHSEKVQKSVAPCLEVLSNYDTSNIPH